ncbi:MAG: hypothetical protein EAZ13_00300 [Sphingobacteriia bacterium]|nr:MAG: hypothetical protein EAZ35_01365 [Sphingobacteriia bacterium]TAH09228.1 MAG: hypothetical protein EAZ13_00300 [Sphingobacteriia bacterium]
MTVINQIHFDFVCFFNLCAYLCSAHFPIWKKEFRGSIHPEMYRALQKESLDRGVPDRQEAQRKLSFLFYG